MSMILLIWYATGWAVCGIAAFHDGELTVRDICLSFICAPIGLIAGPFMLLNKFGSTVIWRKP